MGKRSRARTMLLRCALVSASALLGLGAVELVLRARLAPPLRQIEPRIRHEHIPVDAEQDVSVRYHRLVPDQRGYHLQAAVAVNSLGIRNAEVTLPKPANTFRILVLGDSYTFGFGVEEAQTWPRQLESHLRESNGPRVEVVNAGILALGIEQEIQFLRHRLLPVEPDLVLLTYAWNDLPMHGDPAAPWPQERVLLPESLLPPRAPSSAGSPPASKSLVNRLRATLRKSYLMYVATQKLPALQMSFFPSGTTRWKRALLQGTSTPKIEAAWRFVRGELRGLRDLAAREGFDLLVVPIPLYEQMVGSTYGDGGYQRRLLAICGELGIPAFDPLDAIRASRPSYPESFIPFDGHPGAEIYSVLGQATAEFLGSSIREASSARRPR